MFRVDRISGHLAASPCSSKSEDDVVICCAVRTAITKAKKGGFRSTPPEEMLKALFEEVVQRTNLVPGDVEDIQIGNVLQLGAGAMSSRLGQFLAGFPHTVPISTVNRQCSSGLQAIAGIAASISAGNIDIGIAGGVESMSLFDMRKGTTVDESVRSSAVATNLPATNTLLPAGITSEKVAEHYNVSRKRQDELAAASHAKAFCADAAGKFKGEIVPVATVAKNKDGSVEQVVVDRDDGIRQDTTLESLGNLKPVFQADGSTTPGNASQVSDGAAMVLLARRSVAEAKNLPVVGKWCSFAVAGVPPEMMGIGPIPAVPRALHRAGLNLGDIAVVELNEAFASQVAVVVDELQIPEEKLNPNGGAFALGHPLGCTGSRLVVTILSELKRRKERYGLVTMCVGTGMGAAAVIESEN